MKKLFSMVLITLIVLLSLTFCKKETVQNRLLHYYRIINAKKGLWVENLKTGTVISSNQHTPFYMGSIMRIPLLVTLYYQASKARANLYQKLPIGPAELVYGTGILQNNEDVKFYSMRELAKIMMYANDMTAMDVILKTLGIDNVKKALEEMKVTGIQINMDNNTVVKKLFELESDQYKFASPGMIRQEAIKKEKVIFAMDSSRLVNVYADTNTATPSALGTLFKKLIANELMPENFTKEVLEIMAMGAANNSLIYYALPAATTVQGASSLSQATMSNASVIMSEKAKMIFIFLSNFNRDGRSISLRRLAYISRLAYMSALPVIIE